MPIAGADIFVPLVLLFYMGGRARRGGLPPVGVSAGIFGVSSKACADDDDDDNEEERRGGRGAPGFGGGVPEVSQASPTW